MALRGCRTPVDRDRMVPSIANVPRVQTFDKYAIRVRKVGRHASARKQESEQ
jgi:hypothetical protein